MELQIYFKKIIYKNQKTLYLLLYTLNKLLKTISMSCGCKNKGNQTPPVPQAVQPPQGSTTTQTQTSNQVQESIRKVVEKYYNKK